MKTLGLIILSSCVAILNAGTPDTFKVPPEFGRKFAYIPAFEDFYKNKYGSEKDTSCWAASSPLWLLRNPSLLTASALPASPVISSNYVTVINTSPNTDPKDTKIETDMKPTVKKVGDKWVITFKKK